MQFAKPEVILCDLDGTLVNSVPDLAWCADEMLTRLGLPACGEDKVSHWVGNGLNSLLKRVLTNDINGEPEAELLTRAKQIFTDLYERHSCERSHLYDGVQQGLTELVNDKIRLGCVTNKDERFTLPILQRLGIATFFDIVISGDTLTQKKPHPAPLLHGADFFGVAPENAMMIGDSVNDVNASRAAGFRIICMSYGYNHGADIRNAEPDAVIDNFAQLKSLFR
jgi:phosphoglycolate phosphatase